MCPDALTSLNLAPFLLQYAHFFTVLTMQQRYEGNFLCRIRFLTMTSGWNPSHRLLHQLSRSLGREPFKRGKFMHRTWQCQGKNRQGKRFLLGIYCKVNVYPWGIVIRSFVILKQAGAETRIHPVDRNRPLRDILRINLSQFDSWL